MNCIKRLKNLQEYIVKKDVDLLIIDDPIALKYLTNLHLSCGKLFVAKDKIKLFVDGRYLQVAKSKSPIEVKLITEKSLFDFIIQNSIKNVGFDSDKISYNSFEKLKSFTNKINASNQLDIKLIALLEPLKDFRVIKDDDEILIMKKAAALNWRGFEYICSLLKEGITERELALQYEIFVKKNGAESLSFDSIVAFGKNSAMPHYKTADAKLKLNDIVLIDIGCSVDSYHSDMTRVIFFGTPDPMLEKMYSVTKRSQSSALKMCRPGSKLKDLDIACRKVLKEENFEKEFVHSLGHGVGLEVHEFPRIKFDGIDKDVILKPGMVITIEPGLYVPDIGGVRYEDTIIITKDGYENFYSS